MRLDLAVVDRGLARSRTHAQTLIASGVILLDGSVVSKASLNVADDAAIELTGPSDHYVSRAAHKLIGALDACAPLGLSVAGRVALDAGASTGGFTQVLLERDVAHVTAVDVGHGQIAKQLRADDRVSVVEDVNVRDLEKGSLREDTDLVVADLSFISLTMVIPAIVGTVARQSDFVLMVKPQFEVGRGRLGKHGVVTDLSDRAAAVEQVMTAMRAAGLAIHHISRSDLPGPHGNVEFFVWGSSAWQGSHVGRDQDNETTDAQSSSTDDAVAGTSAGGLRPMLDHVAATAAVAHEVTKG
ncbi:TlyA family RNA methyltransferase [Demequina aurantiaca]|uniref:TlyA family RNA methyltransferase n=1 Tax=Demequina aurantiaca TaxID=676200 RepID=UPI003D327525